MIGDERFAAADFARAKAELSRALELEASGPRSAALRAKRGAAAAAAGDDEAALKDLKVLAPDPLLLTRDDARRAGLAGLAPALYRLARKQGSKRELLDQAWRLGDPPSEMRSELAELWATEAHDRGVKIGERLVATAGATLSDEEIDVLRVSFEHGHRAYVLAPEGSIRRHWNDAYILRSWAMNSEANFDKLARAFEGWPDQPIVEDLRAKHAGKKGRWKEALTAAQNGLRHVPPSHPDNEGAIHELVVDLAQIGAEAWCSAQPGADVELLTRAAEQAESAMAWAWLGRGWLDVRKDHARARECLDRARTVEAGKPTAVRFVAQLEVQLLDTEGKQEEATQVLLAAVARTPDVETAWLAGVRLEEKQRWAELAALPPPRAEDLKNNQPQNGVPGGLLCKIVRALGELGRLDDAEKLARESESAVPAIASELEPILARFRKGK
jgi:tetratricopeptide (TPR) repeat protein